MGQGFLSILYYLKKNQIENILQEKHTQIFFFLKIKTRPKEISRDLVLLNLCAVSTVWSQSCKASCSFIFFTKAGRKPGKFMIIWFTVLSTWNALGASQGIVPNGGKKVKSGTKTVIVYTQVLTAGEVESQYFTFSVFLLSGPFCKEQSSL